MTTAPKPGEKADAELVHSALAGDRAARALEPGRARPAGLGNESPRAAALFAGDLSRWASPAEAGSRQRSSMPGCSGGPGGCAGEVAAAFGGHPGDSGVPGCAGPWTQSPESVQPHAPSTERT